MNRCGRPTSRGECQQRVKNAGEACFHHRDELTAKQQRFVAEYLVDLNATQAAVRAGYSQRTAAEMGYENLRKPQIADAIQQAMEARAEKLEITADRVLQELARMAFANMADYINVLDDGSAVVDLSELTPAQSAAIQEITSDVYVEGRGDDAERVKKIKFKLHSRCRPLELLGKHLGMFDDRLQIKLPPGLDVRVNLVKPGDGHE